MKKRCTPCLSQDIKDIISEKLRDSRIDQLLDSIKTCDTELTIELCGKKVRPRSAYQEFVGNCLRGKHLKKFDPGALKECAAEWRQQKKS